MEPENRRARKESEAPPVLDEILYVIMPGRSAFIYAAAPTTESTEASFAIAAVRRSSPCRLVTGSRLTGIHKNRASASRFPEVFS